MKKTHSYKMMSAPASEIFMCLSWTRRGFSIQRGQLNVHYLNHKGETKHVHSFLEVMWQLQRPQEVMKAALTRSNSDAVAR